MRRLIPYYRKYWYYFVLAILLLVVQSNADLSLPDYLSRIVNIGIQQNGIDTGVPEVISRNSMDQLALFQTEEEHQALLNAFHLVEPDSQEAKNLSQRFPAVAHEPVLVLNSAEEAAQKELESLMSKPMIMKMGFQMIQTNPSMASQIFGLEFQSRLGNLPQDMDLLELLKALGPEMKASLIQQSNEKLSQFEGSMLHSLAVRAVSAEYQSLGMDMQKTQTAYIWSAGRVMILLSLITAVASISVSYFASRTAAGVAHDLRSAIFKKILGFSSAEYSNFSTASLITRSTNDITQVQQLTFMIIRMAFMAPMIATVGIIRAINKSPNMWWLIALGVLVLVSLIMSVFIIVLPKFKVMQKLVDKINLVTRENLTGMMVVRAFNKQKMEEARFDAVNKDLTRTMLFVGRAFTSIFPFANLVMTSLNVLIIWVGAHAIANSTLMIGDLIAFMQYSMQIMFSFLNLSILFIMIPRAAVSGDRIVEVLDTQTVIQDPQQPRALPQPFQGHLVFNDVDFAFAGAKEDVLHDISFESGPGMVTSIIGSTGSGKSTLVNLIPRLYDVTKGSVTLDGIDVRDLRQKDLREVIGFVPQKALLFSGTVESNLQVGKPDASEQEMKEAIEIAQAKDFVFNSENSKGLEKEIAQAGANVSGGQKQRLSIARALIKNAPVLIFDDSFSALDFKTDAALRAALADRMTNVNLLVVTQRVATAKTSDQILVLNDGRLVGKGKHKDLMETCQTYREIAQSQLSAEELAA